MASTLINKTMRSIGSTKGQKAVFSEIIYLN